MSNLNKSLQAQKEMITNLVGNIHTAAPGTVLAYDPGTGRATVQSLIPFRVDAETLVDSPPIVQVPIVFPSGSGGNASITFPILPGDGVLLVFSERALDDFLKGGQSPDPRQYDLTDAMAIPGLYPNAVSGASAYPNDICLNHGGTTLRVENGGNIIASSDVIIGGISFLNHVHDESIGSNTSPPR